MSMFKTYILKDASRSPDKKRAPISRKDLYQFDYDETPLPYFEIMPGKLLTDPRYTQLTRQDQGDFLRLIMFMWLEKCRYPRFPEAMAPKMDMGIEEWIDLEKRLLDAKLLVISPDTLYIIQPVLREQYLMNRRSNESKKRLKSASAVTSAGAFADTFAGAT